MMVDPRFWELIAHTWRGGKFGYLWTPDDGQGAKYTYWRPVPWAGDLPKVFKDKDTYFGVHPSAIRRSDTERARVQDGDITAINCLFAEIDCKTPEEKRAKLEWLARWHIKPACVVDSGGGFHIYVWLKEAWVLDTPEKRQRAADLQWAFAQLVNGDTSVNDLARVLRVPGTINWKAKYAPDYPTVEIVHWEPSAQYDLADLEPHLQPILDARNAQKAHTPPANSGAVDHVADRELLDILFGSKNGVMYQALWSGDLSVASGDHSKADQMLCNGLAWLTGRDALRIDHLFRQSGLMRDKWDRDAYRQSTIDNAINSTQTVYDPNYQSAADQDAVAAARAAVNGNGNGTQPTGQSGQPSGGNAYPYFVKGGRIWLGGTDKKGNDWEKLVCDFIASITQEVTTENGERSFVIEGVGKRGGAFKFDVSAEVMGQSSQFVPRLNGAVGALDPIHADMNGHIAPAIKLLTDQASLKRVRRFQRTGWSDDSFLIVGREKPNTEIKMHKKLVYDLSGSTDPILALDGLAALLKAPGPERATVILAHLLTGPLARLVGWENERYVMFIRGESGTFKTSFTQAAMCIYGKKFISDDNLLKLGQGMTPNALIAIASQVHDMPLFVDNYKPNTDHSNSFVALIHNILEGGEKERLNRASELKDSRSLNCWPVVTGEDLPDTDAASLARSIVTQFTRDVRVNRHVLETAQKLSSHLPYIGNAWIGWLEGAGQPVITQLAAELPAIRDKWIAHLNSLQLEMINPMRVATNLATNELAYKIAAHHPQFGHILEFHLAAHLRGLETIANSMARSTVETAEVERFLTALRDLVTSGTALLIDINTTITSSDRGRVVGWKETDGSVYIIPKVAMSFAERQLGTKFNSVSQISIQMAERGMLQSKGKDQYTVRKRVGVELARVWHLTKIAFEG